jgi:membrane protease YdiL (CAAX protease family)
MLSAIPWDFALILAVLAVLVPWRGSRRVRALLATESLSTSDRISVYASTIAFQWAATAIVLWRCIARGLRLEDLGFSTSRPWLILSVAAGLAILITANQLASLQRLAQLPPSKQGFFRAFSLKLLPRNAVEGLAFFALVVTVSVCEEIIYRGFVQRVFQNVTGGSVTAGIFASAAFFSLAHLYQGRRGLAGTFIAGCIFSGARAWTGSLIPPMVAHFSADALAGFLAPRWLLRAPAENESGAATATTDDEAKNS